MKAWQGKVLTLMDKTEPHVRKMGDYTGKAAVCAGKIVAIKPKKNGEKTKAERAYKALSIASNACLIGAAAMVITSALFRITDRD